MCSTDEMIDRALASFRRGAPEPRPVTDAELDDALVRLAATGFDPRLSPNTREALQAYLEGKSLLLLGSSGSGKTMFFTSLNAARLAPRPLVIYSLMANGAKNVSEVLDELAALRDDEVVVDDFGCESTWAEHRADDLLLRIVALREHAFRRTHFTTNLTSGMLTDRYDERTVSRLKTCAGIAMSGMDNRRKTANAAVHPAIPPEMWSLCEERCPKYADGRCTLGKRIPPLASFRTPEESCGVGEAIPYRKEHIEAEERFRQFREKILAWR